MTGIAVFGLGQMGQGIARRLDAAGLLCAATDTDPARFAQAGFSDRVSDSVEAADIFVFVVPGKAQIEAALAGMSLRNVQLILDLTTSHPSGTIALAERLQADGVAYVDAAMTGGAAGADAGSLTLMMGGAPHVIAQIDPVLDQISKQRFHMGPVGSGHAMKLIHNLILHSAFMATCEGLTLAGKAGLDVDRAVEVLNAGNARSFVTEVRFPRDILGGTMNARSRIANLEKDLGLARQYAKALGGPAVFTGLTHDLLHAAVESGAAETDFSHLFPMFEALAQQVNHG
ncbi:NAD(P)-dependent oxidoreductase [Puniceibacterium confluentis]|uniref:NAD(P)-dependent oxidoreductase n=1 Tax=Puniceibacterium confluentis TaxID=1958944 RepID=UPI0011B58A70|nr:NAD(P)-dependent oxidoreductase [Puniceibacterium confluentis]